MEVTHKLYMLNKSCRCFLFVCREITCIKDDVFFQHTIQKVLCLYSWASSAERSTRTHTGHHLPYTNYIRVSPQADSVCCLVFHCVYLCLKTTH